ncbi:hypothetical protein MNB_SV-5-1779 [hydrothermal vent metagenome]|uniref:ABC-type transport auxiliary lipoprotein component domain-containing protein n=1 Tax=hydrothermal vent metagenome TaxID=652676 RepID=A0A1W1EDY2_9ZZZZ
MKYIVLILSMFLLSSCGLKESKPITEYTLVLEKISPVSSSRYKNKTLKVYFPQSLKEKLTSGMNYSYSLSDRGTYLNSRWSNSIAQLIQGNIIEALDNSRIFKGVLPFSSTVAEDYRLEIEIYDFSHHVRGNESNSVVIMKCSLIATHDGKLKKTRRFFYKIPTKTVDAKGYVEATNIAMNRLMRDLVLWLR